MKSYFQQNLGVVLLSICQTNQISLAAHVGSIYLINEFPCIGRDTERPSNDSFYDYVMLWLRSIKIEMSLKTFFSQVRSLQRRLKSKYSSLVGTIKLSRRKFHVFVKIPLSILYSTMVRIHKDMSLTVYQGKKKKKILL